ncbi:MAG TPA: bifunctional adenosylcobinamide kinase/adenosylcobinamide-phosphate guanylyltransferase [Candidatus Dormibacteraeota bacterium]|jgi:adenosyl cobinamide kinase/adenosyl cobinamide phosphate guanylyltransferase|nr:bifunctional adenosylcobinamide kinase/adenosylcobinamide-phosphate guanylyltransferase [Candidatus Dormibacteraeota bacterium]
MPYTFLIGGARSGKSALSSKMAARAGTPVTLIATAEAGDEEMAARIARHRAERPAGWATVEAPLALLDAVRAAPPGDFLIVDCLTLWVSNLLGQEATADAVLAAAGAVAQALADRPAPAVVVSNEVGLGLVPMSPLGREYRDLLGTVNTTFATRARRAALLVAGHVHPLFSAADFLEEP